MEVSGIISEVLKGFGKAASYLEVGLASGKTFREVECFRKVGVDPAPMMGWKEVGELCDSSVGYKLSWRVHDCLSDEVWGKLKGEKFDVIFIDGMHEYRQVVRDMENGMEFLRGDNISPGYMFIHDVNPTNESMAAKWSPGIDRGIWCGDVWKAVLEMKWRGVEYRTLDVPYGLTVLRKQEIRPMSMLVEGDRYDYKYFDENRGDILKGIGVEEFISSLGAGVRL